ncbi:MAG TPA: hypothetical protein VGC24_06260 [Burkholderiaceae bacterium]
MKQMIRACSAMAKKSFENQQVAIPRENPLPHGMAIAHKAIPAIAGNA